MKSIQYTIRNIPPEVDRTLRAQARKSGKSFNTVVVENLAPNTTKKGKSVFDKFYQANAQLTAQDHKAFNESMKWMNNLPNNTFNKDKK